MTRLLQILLKINKSLFLFSIRKSIQQPTLIIVFLTFPLFLPAQDYYETIRNNVTIEMKMNAEIYTVHKGKLKNLNTNFLFLPQNNERQKVISIQYDSDPKADYTDSVKSQFTWKTLHDKYTFWYTAKVKTYCLNYPIQSDPFPITETSENLKKYLEFDETINHTKTIEKQALLLAQNENELFNVVFKTGKWIHENITYFLTGFKEVEPASTVFNTKAGDCIEMSVLFISMLRSLNIPSKLVSGIAKGPEKFELHSWVEVYFPKTGWVPFDPSFAEFGYVDQSHIKLSENFTISPMFSHTWTFLPHFGDLEIDNQGFPEISAEIIDKKPVPFSKFDIEIVPFTDSVSVSSFYPIKILVKNNIPYFMSDKFYVRGIDNIEISGGQQIYFLNFYPNETKEINLILFCKQGTHADKIYRSQLEVYDFWGDADTTQIIFHPEAMKIKEETAKMIIDSLPVSSFKNEK